MGLANKVAIVTGAGRGLGRAAALALATAGVRVVLFSPERSVLEKVAAEIEAVGSEAVAVAGDVSAEDDVNRLCDHAKSRFGKIDILVNNAGIIGPPRFIEDAEPEAWRRTLNVNLNGMYLTCRAVIPEMRRQKDGRIINVTSGLGRMPFPRFCAYGVSKAGVDQLTRSLSEEFRHAGIRVNAIDPGIMDTPMQDEIRHLGEARLGKELQDRFIAFKTEDRLDDPAEVARLVVYLASERAAGISGQILSMADLPVDANS